MVANGNKNTALKRNRRNGVAQVKKKKKKMNKKDNVPHRSRNGGTSIQPPQSSSSSTEQLNFFLQQFQLVNRIKLSPLELESFTGSCILKLSEELNQDSVNLEKHLKSAFGSSWKQVLRDGKNVQGKIDPGNPSVAIISTSAIRSLELLRGLRSLTKECQAVKLFSKHLKVEEQVEMLKKHVNIVSGTPSRIKKLCETEALGLSRLEVIVLDMHTDVKGFSLFNLPQVRDEFWELYKTYFHQRLAQGNLRLCLYGLSPAPAKQNINEDQLHSI